MAQNLLQQYFPMLWVRKDLEERIRTDSMLFSMFQGWKPEQREEFLDFCTGERGVKILYDCFFKEVFNPEYTPERLETLISLIMKQKVRILQVLPNDSVRIADEASLLITDIVVELEDHSIANVEIQKIGYMFPGQRCACYSADLLLRQYKRIRSYKKENFSYKDIQNVYTIVFFEQSAAEFRKFPKNILHCFEQKSNTGLELNLLQKYYFVPLDIFRKNLHNKGIKTELDAWLVFLTCDEPERIAELIQAYPEFKRMYEDIYELCRNMEDVMGLFSKELQELDRNTVQYMIDVMQDEIDASKKLITEQEEQLSEKDKKISEQNHLLKQQELDNQLYALLSRNGRATDLSRAVTDEAFRKQLLEEYQLNIKTELDAVRMSG